MQRKRGKGVSPLIGGVLYFAVVMAAIIIIMNLIIPWIENTKDQIAINYAQKNIAELDSIITTVASEGETSSRTASLDVKRGAYYLNDEKDTIYFQINVSESTMSPRFRTNTGNVFFGSQLNSKATEYDSYFLLENQYLQVNITKAGNSTTYSAINTSEIINSIYYKEKEIYLYGDNITIIPNNYAPEGNGTGYVYLEEEGEFLPKAVAIAKMTNADSGSSYDLYFDLQSDSDFLLIYLKNYSTS
ncbi:MAG: hypothetical protein DRN66_02935 [Candidatus Nanohalarchaeota archaeon]|nr:MAG: hypothetical protein DRN66_02935 [Candidatus Nanohaloarchaeota archaeon]